MLGIFILILLILMTNAYLMTFIRTNQSIKNLSTATALGQAKLEDLRIRSYKDLTSGVDTIKSRINFIRVWTVTDKGALKEIKVTVKWLTHKTELVTLIAK